MGDGVPLDEGVWIAIMALCVALEARHPGFTEDAHDIIVSRLNLTEVIRLNGPRVTPTVMAAFEEAERHLGVIAVVAPRSPTKRTKRRRRDRRRR